MYSDTFLPGQLAALAGLRALRHLDLDLLGGGEIFGGDAEAARGDLLDLRLQQVAFLQLQVAFDAALAEARSSVSPAFDRRVAVAILAAFAGVRLAADAVHRDGQRGVRFGRDRAQRHGAGGEALDDFRRGLDFLDRHRLALVEPELEQPAKRHVPLRLVVDDARVFLVGRVGVAARRMLQLGDRIGRPHVLFAAHAPGVFAAGIERMREHRVVAERRLVHADRLLGHLEHADALDVRGGAGEILVDQLPRQAHRLENLRAGVGHVGRDAHLDITLRSPLPIALT